MSIPNDKESIKQLLFERQERLKELATINHASSILKEGKPFKESLKKLALILPKGWQYPKHTSARITYNKNIFTSSDFNESKWCQSQRFTTIDNKSGRIEIFYTKEYPEIDEGPFLREERDLIINLSGIIAGYLNELLGQVMLKRTEEAKLHIPGLDDKTSCEITSRQLLQKFLNKSNYDRDTYHDLMPFKVKEILLVANLYDAYSIEKEGRFSEHVLGEYQQLSLTSMPRITGISSVDEALEQLYSRHFDLIIIMVGVDKKSPIDISNTLKEKFN